MAEVKQILTRTITTVVGTVLSIYTYFESSIQNFLNFFIRDDIVTIDNINFDEGELGYTKMGYSDFSGSMNDAGELIIVDSVSDYFIDEIGDLISGDVLSIPQPDLSIPHSSSSFFVSWESVDGVSGYYLDVAYDPQFSRYLEGYQNLDVDDVIEYYVEGVVSGVTYYWRVRSYSEEQISESSEYSTGEAITPLEDYDGNLYSVVRIGDQLWTVENWKCTHYDDGEPIPNVTVSSDPYSDWFLPSKDELYQMQVNLIAYGVGEFLTAFGDTIWSSSEVSANDVWVLDCYAGVMSSVSKSESGYTRPCRTFTDSLGEYSLRDRGPSGGWIFYIDGTTCYEVSPNYVSLTKTTWTNTTTLLGATGTVIGTGQSNTTIILGSTTTSAAKLADDYVVDLGWRGLSSGAYCWYDNNIGYKDVYGALYNWFIVDSGHDLASSGWRVPSVSDFNTLVSYLGGTLVAGGKLKEVGVEHWDPPNTEATNESGFTGRGSGYRSSFGIFAQMNQYSFLVASDDSGGSTCSLFTLRYDSAGGNNTSGLSKLVGSSIRLVKDI